MSLGNGLPANHIEIGDYLLFMFAWGSCGRDAPNGESHIAYTVFLVI